MKFPALRRQVVSASISILLLLVVGGLAVTSFVRCIDIPVVVWLLIATAYVTSGYRRMRQPDTVSCAIAICVDHWSKLLFVVVVGVLLWPVRRLAVSMALLVVGR